MRIGVLCHNYPPHPGGLEVVVREVSKRLALRNEVTIVTSAWEGTAGCSSEDGMTVHRLPAVHLTESFGVPYPFPLGRGLASARRALSGCDLLHAHGSLYWGSMLAALLARDGRPLVLTEHVGFVEYSSSAVRAVESLAWRAIGDAVVRRSAAVVAYNERVARWLEQRERRPIHFIGNGVDHSRFAPVSMERRDELRIEFALPRDRSLVLYAGRHTEKKNFPAVLALSRDRFHLVVCGAAERKLTGLENLTDLGVLPHARMPDLLAAVDAMVVPSRGEGFPLAAQEAIAAGVPLVLLWDAGYAAWLDKSVPVSIHELGELQASIQRLLDEAELRGVVSERERRWAVERWSWEATAARYQDLFESVRGGLNEGA